MIPNAARPIEGSINICFLADLIAVFERRCGVHASISLTTNKASNASTYDARVISVTFCVAFTSAKIFFRFALVAIFLA